LAVPPKGPLQKHIQRGEFDLVLENMVHLHLDNQLFPEGGDSRNRTHLAFHNPLKIKRLFHR
jgi:hypothetical protein